VLLLLWRVTSNRAGARFGPRNRALGTSWRAAGTLKLAKVASGLHVTISTPISARGYVESVRRRDFTAMSFAFRALDDTWRLVDGIPIREVLDAQISEVSAVAFPAYRSTTLGADGTGRALDLARRQLQTLLTR
jgi:HK97 family phage prohead protease